MVVAGIVIFGLITYFKKWQWLWREWLTTVDPKKIGVMYLIVALIMLLRGGADALMMRAQQATSVGSSHGCVIVKHIPAGFFGARHDYDFLCGDGATVRPCQFGGAAYHWGTGCGVSVFECYQLLAVYGRHDTGEFVASAW